MSSSESKRDKPARLVDARLEEEAPSRSYDVALLARLAPFLRPHLKLFAAALLLMPMAAGAGLLQPYFVKLAIDATLITRTVAALASIVSLFATAVAIEFVARFAQNYLMQLAGQRSTADLRSEVFRHIHRLPVGYFDNTPVGRVVTRVTNDIDSLTELFASGAVTAVADVLTLLGIVGFMFYLDWHLTLVVLFALVPLAAIVNVFRRFAREAFRAIRLRIAQLNAYLAEQVQGISVTQAFGREADCAVEYEDINAAYRDANYKAIRYDALLYSVVEAVSVACVAMVLWYASVAAGLLPDDAATAAYVGTVVAFYQYISRFFVPIRDLATKYTIIQHSLAAAERIFALLDVDRKDAPARDIDDAPDVGSDVALAFRSVSFAYREGHDVLHDVDFEIRRGEKIAIVGATGSGKTTLTALLLRLYEFDRGHILVHGRDVRTLTREELRSQFATVPQDVFLFAGSVLENVALGDPSPDREKAQRAIARVGAEELVTRRGGLEAPVDERGANFSAGERQLLAFARALYSSRDFLILDEATANVDSETEHQLQSAVNELLEGRTAIVIAHRLSTIRRADRILVFHHGRIVEQGSHQELLAEQGVYARLHQLQFEGDEGVTASP